MAQNTFPVFKYAAVEVQTVLAAVQSGERLKIANCAVQTGNIGGGYVGRIAADQIKVAHQHGRGLQYICLKAGDSGAELVQLHILAADAQGGGALIHHYHAGCGQLMGYGAAYAAAAAAEIQNSGIHLLALHGLQRQIYHKLGIHAGDEGAAIHQNGNAVELPLAGDVAHGLALQAALYHGQQLLLNIVAGVKAHITHKSLGGLACGICHHDACLKGIALDSGILQLLSRPNIQVVICLCHVISNP